MWLALDAVKKGEADVAVSAGNTGALMAMARFCSAEHGRHRAARDRRRYGRRCRASPSCSTSAPRSAPTQTHLVNLAAMGSAMARVLFDIERPTVGLLNIGVEEVKGLEQVREAGRILRETNLPRVRLSRLRRRRRYRQGHRRRRGDRRLRRQYRAEDRGRHRAADRRAICARAMTRTWTASSAISWRAAAFRALREKMDPRKSNGGVFLGLNGIVIKSHGGTDAEGTASAIDIGYDMVRYELLAKIGQSMARDLEPRPRVWRAELMSHAALGRAGLRQLSAEPHPHQSRNWRKSSRRPTNGSCSARAFASVTSPRQGEMTSDLGAERGATPRSRMQSIDATSDRFDRARHLDAGPDLSGDRGDGAGRARHHARRRVRPAGGVLGIRLRAGDRRRASAQRRVQARAGDRRGDVLAHSRLERPHHLRAVRRRRRRGGARGAGAAPAPCRIAAF